MMFYSMAMPIVFFHDTSALSILKIFIQVYCAELIFRIDMEKDMPSDCLHINPRNLRDINVAVSYIYIRV